MYGLAQKSHCTGPQRPVFLFLAPVGAEEEIGDVAETVTRSHLTKRRFQNESRTMFLSLKVEWHYLLKPIRTRNESNSIEQF
jgi:hypothetical protein